jgi:hypothetical protein
MGFFDVVNLYGLIFVVIMIVPHIIFVKTHRYSLDKVTNRTLLYIARIGKYCGAFLMAINIGVLEEGFTSDLMKNFWLVATAVLVAAYIILWLLFFKKENKACAILLTVVAGIVLMLSGLLQVKTLLLTAGIVYLIGELYVTIKLFE